MGDEAQKRAERIVNDPAAREIWCSHGHVCKGELPARITLGSSVQVEAPVYHIHLGPNFALQTKWSDSPEVRTAMSGSPHVNVDVRGQAQQFKRLSIKQAVIYEKMEQKIVNFYRTPITQYEASLLMARMWANDRFSTLNPLTSSVISRDIGAEANAVSAASQWVVPAQCALKALGFEASSVKRVLDFRETNQDAFDRYAATLRDLHDQIQTIPSDPNFSKEVENLVKAKIQPSLDELGTEIRAAAVATRINSGFFALITLGGVALTIVDPANWTGGVGTAIGALGTAANMTTEWWKGKVAKNSNPLYFLWKARKHGLIRKG